MEDKQHFDLDQLRHDINIGHRYLHITTHAQVEAFKDGLLLADLRHVFQNGDLIELYPDEARALLYADTLADKMPVHIVVEDIPDAGVIVTAYVPDRRKWIANKRRKKKGL